MIPQWLFAWVCALRFPMPAIDIRLFKLSGARTLQMCIRHFVVGVSLGFLIFHYAQGPSKKGSGLLTDDSFPIQCSAEYDTASIFTARSFDFGESFKKNAVTMGVFAFFGLLTSILIRWENEFKRKRRDKRLAQLDQLRKSGVNAEVCPRCDGWGTGGFLGSECPLCNAKLIIVDGKPFQTQREKLFKRAYFWFMLTVLVAVLLLIVFFGFILPNSY